MGRMIDMVGKTFGRLTVISLDGKLKSGECVWSCVCSCGQMKVVAGRYLRTGRTKSCGCLHRQKSQERCIALNKSGVPQKAKRKKKKYVSEHNLCSCPQSGGISG